MNIFDSVGGVIGANNRRAALIIGLNCDHPDIEEFLDVKRNNTAIQSANISILFTDEFMEAVENGDNYELKFTVEATGEVISKTIDARGFFMKFCEAQHDWCEPGALFIDTVRENNLMSGYPKGQYNIEICNPLNVCGFVQ
jgi:ribonucleoside-diphosphate reductase alpha chain